jgi:hypothetical protein
MFSCRKIDKEYWLNADMRLQCYTSQWAGYAFYAVLMGVVYIVGFPLLVYRLLHRHRHELFTGDNSDGVKAKYGFLYLAYGPTAWWWEVEELIRKLLLSAVVVLIEQGSSLQVMFLGRLEPPASGFQFFFEILFSVFHRLNISR